jgi:hypothetical protein
LGKHIFRVNQNFFKSGDIFSACGSKKGLSTSSAIDIFGQGSDNIARIQFFIVAD